MKKKTIAKSVTMIVFSIALSQGDVFANWTAYNDLGVWGGLPNHTNTTEIDSGDSGELLKSSDGSGTGVTLDIAAVGDAQNNQGVVNAGYPDAETEAYSEFNSFVDLDGYIYGNWGGFSLTLSGLDPTKTYEAVLFGNRGGNYNDRFTKVILGGADRFTNNSTLGAVISGSNNETTRIMTGNTTVTGQVFRYSDIASGADGIITFTIPAGERNYLNAFKLSETGSIPRAGSLFMLY